MSEPLFFDNSEFDHIYLSNGMMCKSIASYLSQQIKDCTKNSTMEVLIFLQDFYKHNMLGRDDQDVLRLHFRSGYCYYFAHMLKVAFGRGEVCWCSDQDHFVWLDTDNTAYDAEGVSLVKCDYYIPERYLGDYVNEYKHLYSHAEEIDVIIERRIRKRIIENYLKDMKEKETNIFN